MARGRPARPIPMGFVDDVDRLSRKALLEKYRAGPSTIARWKEQLRQGRSIEQANSALGRSNRLEMQTCNWRNAYLVRAWR